MARLRIFTWNLWHALDPYGRVLMRPMESPSERKARHAGQCRVLSALKRSPFDVFCLQEVNPARSRRVEIESALGSMSPLEMKGSATVVNTGIKLGRLGLPPGLQEGLAIFAGDGFSERRFRETTLSGKARELGPLTLQLGERRKALRFEASLEGTRIAIVNVHLHNGSDQDPAALGRKTEEVERLVEWMLEWMAEGISVVCGDFNSDPDSSCMKPLLSAGFKEITGREPSWDPSVNPLAAKSGEHAHSSLDREWDSARHVFDRVYVKTSRPLLNVSHERIVEPSLSDHFGVGVDISF